MGSFYHLFFDTRHLLLIIIWGSFWRGGLFFSFILYYIYMRLFSACFLHIPPGIRAIGVYICVSLFYPLWFLVMHIPLCPHDRFAGFLLLQGEGVKSWHETSRSIGIIGPWSILSVRGSSLRMAFYSVHQNILFIICFQSFYLSGLYITSSLSRFVFFSFFPFSFRSILDAPWKAHFTCPLFVCTLLKALGGKYELPRRIWKSEEDLLFLC